MDLTSRDPVLSSSLFELTFLTDLPPLSLSTYTIRMVNSNEDGAAVLATVYCKNCIGTMNNLFEINGFQVRFFRNSVIPYLTMCHVINVCYLYTAWKYSARE